MSLRLSTTLLPQSLLDYTILRLRPVVQKCSGPPLHPGWPTRAMQTMAAPSAPPSIPIHHIRPRADPPSRLPQYNTAVLPAGLQSTALSELEERVQALKTAAELEETAAEPLNFSEEDLLLLYEDLLNTSISHPTSATPSGILDESLNEADLELVHSAYQRLCQDAISVPSGAESLPADQAVHSRTYNNIISRVNEILQHLESARAAFSSSTSLSFPPVVVLTLRECEALVRVALQTHDGLAAKTVLEIMKRENMTIPSELLTSVMEFYANAGQVSALQHLLQNYLAEFPNERQRHLHVKAHIKSYPPDAVPISALELLHSYEQQSHPAPMSTYTTLITTLFSTQSSVARAHAWDLFGHMRYVAHATPDAALYTLMIRACASPISSRYSSEPERALDLWHEMTMERGLSPTVGTYAAVILACARSGKKAYVNEAFRIARQMLDSHRNAQGISAFQPDTRIFCALLEGAKRTGDLARARWILVEIAKGQNEQGQDVSTTEINEEVMMHIFQAYAAYRPPFQRNIAKLVDKDIANGEPGKPSSTQVKSEVPVTDSTPTFSHIPPQSHSEVAAEARLLFGRVLNDLGVGSSTESDHTIFTNSRTFAKVELTPRLLNSYLSIFYKHSNLETSHTLFRELFRDLGVPPTVRSYVEALERCAATSHRAERTFALQFAREIWPQFEEHPELKESQSPSIHRLIERAHVALIRVSTLNDDLTAAVEHVRTFVDRYPPSSIRNIPQKPSFRSTRTTLSGDRPLVRIIPTTEIPDDYVPPLLTFTDLEVLHHRLVAVGNTKDIGYIKYVCKAYEWALRVRRDETLKAEPEK
ncbi:hypothetical protein BDN72DRAFT_817329 [Pluteus cervinus]|uniref:Uncharacterized protein n=1 Tax=Pluteus cervinus TaxID=181527 RepID=A0ACD3B1W8_9AGAR|nr:hypothetical protein BDN72DRAFT_817329 [Pluteus cervinus]